MISKRRSFTGRMKIEKVSPIFKGGNNLQTGNYRQILAVIVFSKILEKNMNNRVCNYFKENKLLFPKQLDFQINTSTEHTILELVRILPNSLKKTQSMLEVSIYLNPIQDGAGRGGGGC